jgi:DNA-directed RNA polymerase specialized sigma24 family protein
MDTLAEQIASAYWRKNPWIDRSDLIQEAHAADAACRRTYDAKRGTPLSAYRRASIRRALWGYVLHERSPVSGTDRRALRTVYTAEFREAPAGLDATWCARVRVVLADALAGEPLARDVLLLGYRPSEVADRDSVPVDEVYRAVARAKYRLRRCGALLDLLDARLAQHTQAC